MSGTAARTRASWSVTRRRTPEQPPLHDAAPLAFMTKPCCGRPAETCRSQPGHATRGSARSPLHVLIPTWSGSSCPVLGLGVPSRIPTGARQEPVYSVRQPCRCFLQKRTGCPLHSRCRALPLRPAGSERSQPSRVWERLSSRSLALSGTAAQQGLPPAGRHHTHCTPWRCRPSFPRGTPCSPARGSRGI